MAVAGLQFCLGLSNMALWVRSPLAASQSSSTAAGRAGSTSAAPGAATQPTPESPRASQPLPGDPWHRWNLIRCLCDHSTQLGIALEIPASLPQDDSVQRWFGEPVKALLLPTTVFITNRRGYPALSRAHQALLLKFFGYGVQVTQLADLQLRGSDGSCNVSIALRNYGVCHSTGQLQEAYIASRNATESPSENLLLKSMGQGSFDVIVKLGMSSAAHPSARTDLVCDPGDDEAQQAKKLNI